MNLLKGFGGGGIASMGSKPQAAKPNYFSNLKLQDEPAAKGKGKPADRSKGPPKGFIPNKFALSFDPPCISSSVLTESWSTGTPKTRNSITTRCR